MRYVFYNLDGDPELPVYGATTNSSDLGPLLINLVGIGQPFWIFQDTQISMDILQAEAIAIDFTDAPVCSGNYAANRAAAAACMAEPPVGMITAL